MCSNAFPQEAIELGGREEVNYFPTLHTAKEYASETKNPKAKGTLVSLGAPSGTRLYVYV